MPPGRLSSRNLGSFITVLAVRGNACDAMYLDARQISGIRLSSRAELSGYLTPFTSELEIDLGSHDFMELRLRGWGPLDLIPIPIGK